VAASRERNPQLDLAESLALLLQTWNKDYYTRYRRRSFDDSDFKAMRHLLKLHAAELEKFRFRRVDTLEAIDDVGVRRLFRNFEPVLGPVGTAKALHLLAPDFFPLWDRNIARDAYGIYLKGVGQNADNYMRLMRLTAGQVQRLGGWTAMEAPLKAIDEFNYVVYTKKSPKMV
jgi:hypothetical protein